MAGIRSGAGGPPIRPRKAGVISLVQTAANELYGTGVRVNAIAPGLIETGMTKPIFDGARARGNEDRIGQLNPLTPLRRAATRSPTSACSWPATTPPTSTARPSRSTGA